MTFQVLLRLLWLKLVCKQPQEFYQSLQKKIRFYHGFIRLDSNLRQLWKAAWIINKSTPLRKRGHTRGWRNFCQTRKRCFTELRSESTCLSTSSVIGHIRSLSLFSMCVTCCTLWSIFCSNGARMCLFKIGFYYNPRMTRTSTIHGAVTKSYLNLTLQCRLLLRLLLLGIILESQLERV